MLTLQITNDESHGNSTFGNYDYVVRVKRDVVIRGKIEDHNRNLHSVMLIEKVLEDMKAKLHEERHVK